jgi:hypothetical protein
MRMILSLFGLVVVATVSMATTPKVAVAGDRWCSDCVCGQTACFVTGWEDDQRIHVHIWTVRRDCGMV